jgi:hypothetical protein
MMRQFFAQNLAFMAIIASIMASLPAQAKNNPFADTAQIATLHCQLWQRQLKHYEPAISPEDFRQILGRNLAEEDAEALYASTFGLADFSFLLGDWRTVATRAQRQQFNQHMFQKLEAYWKTAPHADEPSCLMEVTLTARPVPEDTELPAPRLLAAEIRTTLLGVPLTYQLAEELNGWHYEDIKLGMVSLRQEYLLAINHKLKEGGFQNLINNPLQAAEY